MGDTASRSAIHAKLNDLGGGSTSCARGTAPVALRQAAGHGCLGTAPNRGMRSPFVKYEEQGEGDAAKTCPIIPLQFLGHVQDGKDMGHCYRGDVLGGL